MPEAFPRIQVNLFAAFIFAFRWLIIFYMWFSCIYFFISRIFHWVDIGLIICLSLLSIFTIGNNGRNIETTASARSRSIPNGQ